MNLRVLLPAIALASISTLALAEEAPAPVPLPHCDAPIASVVVGKLQCKAANCDLGRTSGGEPAGGIFGALQQIANAQTGGAGNVVGIGDGIKDVLVTALTESGCFVVQDREQMAELQAELALVGKTLQAQQAEYLISGAITQIDISVKQSNLGGGLIPVVGAVGKKTQHAAVGLDLKLVNVDTATVVASKNAQAAIDTKSWNLAGGGVAPVGGTWGGFGGAFSSLKGTNLEAVTKDAIAKGVTFLVEAARADKANAAAAGFTGAPK